MEKVIIVGVFNFIGYSLATHLLNEGKIVFGLSNQLDGERADIDQKLLFIGRNANFQYYMGDEIKKIESHIMNEHFDSIYYCQHDPTTFQYKLDTELYIKQSKAILNTILKCSFNKKIKLIYISTLDIFANNLNLIDETTRPNPHKKHAIIHYKEEQTIKQLANIHNISYVIIRVPTIYGPWQPKHLIYQQIMLGHFNGQMSHVEMMESPNDLLFIDDVIRAMIKAGESQLTNEIIHLTSGKENEWKKGINILLGNNQFFIERDRIMPQFKNEKAKKLLDFVANTDINDGIKKQQKHIELLDKFSI